MSRPFNGVKELRNLQRVEMKAISVERRSEYPGNYCNQVSKKWYSLVEQSTVDHCIVA
jgi:hypothetical protein